MLYNQHLQCAPEIKQYLLVNNLTKDERLVTMEQLEAAFEDRPDELQRVKTNRSDVWFLEDYFYE
ncbi:hypothetical protein [Cronobacter phage vB_Cdu_VP8]|nr:hypothetical protein [Cronobacter phage vB_Cdu_VP8]